MQANMPVPWILWEASNPWILFAGEVLHVLSLPWKLIFALVPPTEYCGGWPGTSEGREGREGERHGSWLYKSCVGKRQQRGARTPHLVWRFILFGDGNACQNNGLVLSDERMSIGWLLSLEQLSNWLAVGHSSENQDVFVYSFTLKLVWEKGFMFKTYTVLHVCIPMFPLQVVRGS